MESAYIKMMDVVKEWDPFHYGAEFYETEASDVVQLISEFDDANYIAPKIQHIYFMSFEKVIEMQACKELAMKLLELKNTEGCEL